jgi:hypothetical protein
MTPANTQIPVSGIPGLTLIETTPIEQMGPVVAEMTKDAYPHEQVYGQFCCVQSYIAAPPEYVFDYMAPVESLGEWTYSLRGFRDTDQPGVMVARDTIGEETDIYCRSVADRSALTVDYHCAWDQGDHLWMIYLNRIVDAQLVLNKPGSVVFWQNCRHPFYDANPFPETAPASRPVWVGDVWNMFYAGHELELQNLKRIVEHRYAAEQSG